MKVEGVEMDHVAIMKKSWMLLEKIISGEKKIESRWYSNKSSPWNKIKPDDNIYFKNSGEPITVMAKVERVMQFDALNHNKVRKIISEYGEWDGIGINDRDKFFELFKDKEYCILIFLKNPKRIEPFSISKKGFGSMTAWMTLPQGIEGVRRAA
ncbi:ASCH domain-containing protein [Candidatus Pacearchaeota archaeon]|nr:ASCH domain-containing protein [Candidatus Pacearchaeota archaeon]